MSAANYHDLAVILERNPSRSVFGPEVGGLLAVPGEARVERAVRVVAGEGEVVEVASSGPYRDDFAVRLERHVRRSKGAVKVGHLLAVTQRSSCRASRLCCSG